MKVIVCGGRDFSDRAFVFGALDSIDAACRIDLVIHGAASGADSLAEEWAWNRGVGSWPCPVDWATHGRAAGPIRNRHMLTIGAELLVAFPGGKGTADMIKQAKSKGVQVFQPMPLEQDHTIEATASEKGSFLP